MCPTNYVVVIYGSKILSMGILSPSLSLPLFIHRLTATKATPNKGRKFWKCSKPKESQCDLFKWVDEEKQSDGVKRKRKHPQTSTKAAKRLKWEDKPLTINIQSIQNVNIST